MPDEELRGARWRRSSYSNGGNDGDCVEVAFDGTAVAVRDSKDSGGPVLVFPVAALRGVKRFC